MRYSKPALSVDDQARLLVARGMRGDLAEIAARLNVVSYYRLSGYWYQFRKPNSDDLKDGTEFSQVWDLYTFDRQLRLLVMDPIERLEVFVRTQLAHHHSMAHGPMAYANRPDALPDLTAERRRRFLEKLGAEREQARRSKIQFVTHFERKYTSEPELPVWMAVELLSFGGTLTFFRGAGTNIRNKVAAPLGVNAKILESWLVAISTVRNVCAHHQRLWNREFGTHPKIPDHDGRWVSWPGHAKHPCRAVAMAGLPEALQGHPGRVGTMLMILRHCLRALSPDSNWCAHVNQLFAAHPGVHRLSMGLPAGWETHLLWK